ncbi:Uncharacterised protein [Mycobacteroides abscessus]|nr:Uncharacterised protein [Mycobacteroides abscessus]
MRAVSSMVRASWNAIFVTTSCSVSSGSISPCATFARSCSTARRLVACARSMRNSGYPAYPTARQNRTTVACDVPTSAASSVIVLPTTAAGSASTASAMRASAGRRLGRAWRMRTRPSAVMGSPRRWSGAAGRCRARPAAGRSVARRSVARRGRRA